MTKSVKETKDILLSREGLSLTKNKAFKTCFHDQLYQQHAELGLKIRKQFVKTILRGVTQLAF